jgi:hypothetical protein
VGRGDVIRFMTKIEWTFESGSRDIDRRHRCSGMSLACASVLSLESDQTGDTSVMFSNTTVPVRRLESRTLAGADRRDHDEDHALGLPRLHL